MPKDQGTRDCEVANRIITGPTGSMACARWRFAEWWDWKSWSSGRHLLDGKFETRPGANQV
jgi:hypothetical protein